MEWTINFILGLLCLYGFSILCIIGGGYGFYIALINDTDKLNSVRHRLIESAVPEDKQTEVKRIVWFIGGPLCMGIGILFALAPVYFILFEGTIAI